jgi:hypothetical protein
LNGRDKSLLSVRGMHTRLRHQDSRGEADASTLTAGGLHTSITNVSRPSSSSSRRSPSSYSLDLPPSIRLSTKTLRNPSAMRLFEREQVTNNPTSSSSRLFDAHPRGEVGGGISQWGSPVPQRGRFLDGVTALTEPEWIEDESMAAAREPASEHVTTSRGIPLVHEATPSEPAAPRQEPRGKGVQI